ncbi:hypothetical protein V5799_014719 [Amblyomma americanum]|uniref:Uncharacterized protein n=1 Tax=Amblyomma americanum TaxID=6943 RepID=A0AAQ4E275_AMBAM
MKPRPPPKATKGPTPRLPDGEYKIIFRSRSPSQAHELQRGSTTARGLHRAEDYGTGGRRKRSPAGPPRKQHISVSMPAETPARAYAALKSLCVREEQQEINANVPPPGDSRRGIVFNAYSCETDEEIYAEFRKRNPNLNVVRGRRLGKSRHMQGRSCRSEFDTWRVTFDSFFFMNVSRNAITL